MTPTVPVTVTLVSQDGVPYAGVTVRARLDVNEVYQGFVISDVAEAVTDATGVAILNCFPNAPDPTGLGTQGSTYSFRATIPGGRALNVEARVPNAPCRLENILVNGTAVSLDAAQLAVLQAQATLSSAATQAGNAANSAAAAATSATNATAARDAALATANATMWVAGTNYAKGDNVISPMDLLTYRRKGAGAGATDPSADSANWTRVALAAADLQAQSATSFTTAGSGNAYTGTPTPAITAYAANQRFCVTFHADSGGDPTLQISGLAGPLQLVKLMPDGTFLSIKAGEIKANLRSDVVLLGGGQAWVKDLPVAPSSGYFKVRGWGGFDIGLDAADAGSIVEHLESAATRNAWITPGLRQGWTCTILNGTGASSVVINAGGGELLRLIGTGAEVPSCTIGPGGSMTLVKGLDGGNRIYVSGSNLS